MPVRTRATESTEAGNDQATRAQRRASTPRRPRASTTPRGSTRSRRSGRPPKRRRTTRTRLRLADDDGDEGSEEVEVSSSVRLVTTGDSESDNADDNVATDANNEDERSDEAGRADSSTPSARSASDRPRHDPSGQQQRLRLRQQQEQHQQSDEELENMDWWNALSPSQQSQARRFLGRQPTVAAPTLTTASVAAVPAVPAVPVTAHYTATAATPAVPVHSPTTLPRFKRKKLNIDDFKGTPGESIEAWLATVQQEVCRQEKLGGDLWTPVELYYGATAHLKGDANKWLVSISENLEEDDYTFQHLTRQLRKKFGRRENTWQIQKRLSKREQQPGERLDSFANSLTSIGFGKRVSPEAYVETFLDGLNNQIAAAHVRTMMPRTLDEAVEFAVDAYGEFGEGRKVTDWRVAEQRYRREDERPDEAKPAARKVASAKPDAVDQIDWKKLGLGFGESDNPPRFDEAGNRVRRLDGMSTNESLPLAALRAIAIASGVGQMAAAAPKPQPKAPASKPKAAKSRAIKAENEDTTADSLELVEEDQRPQRRNAARVNSVRGGRGGFGGRGRGRGDYGVSRYGPSDSERIARLKAETACHFCGEAGHWWAECPDLQEHKRRRREQNHSASSASTDAVATPLATTPTTPAGNDQRQ